MRGFFSRKVPAVTRILLVESGPRELGQRVVARLQAVFPDAQVDILCCLPSPPAGAARAWEVQKHPGGRGGLLRELRRERHPVAAVLIGGDAIMAPWRWATLALLPAKFLVVNEHADFFWLDRGHIGPLFQFLQHRSGLGEESTLRTLLRVFAYPFAFVYLVAYAGYVHGVRLLRLALGLNRRARA